MENAFLDHAATTAVDPLIIKGMIPYFTKYYGNASSPHSFGSKAQEALENARNQIAESIHAKRNEIIFTEGGTESDNIALKGIAYANKQKQKTNGPHIITSSIEHPAVLETCKYLEYKASKYCIFQ